MIRVITYDSSGPNHATLRFAVESAMVEAGARNFGIKHVIRADDLINEIHLYRPGFFSIAVCVLNESQPAEQLAMLRTLREEDPDLRIMVIASSLNLAYEAVAAGISAFFQTSEDIESFKRTLRPLIERAIERHGQTIGLRTKQGVTNVGLDDLLFAESTKRGSIVHLSTGSTLFVRSPLYSLYEQLPDDGSFVKAGNSFIVNLESVRSFGERALVFSSGESIVVPVRIRKPLMDTLSSCWKGSPKTD